MLVQCSFPETCALDPDQLEALRYSSGKLIAQCPSCHAEGRDTKRDNLAIFDDGSYHCITGCDSKAIFALAGKSSDRNPDPLEKRRWQKEQAARRAQDEQRRLLATQAKAKRQAIVERHQWTREEILADSPQDMSRPMIKRFPDRYMMMTLFPDDALLWSGEVHESGTSHAGRWRKAYDHRLTDHRTGTMTTPAIWKAGTTNRIADNVSTAPYVVLDFDGFDGIKPETKAHLQAHLRASAALVRCIREEWHWQLAALVFTGSKSLHAWFHTPAPDVLQSLKDIAPELGIDAGLIDQPAHPCRLPGHRHEKTGRLSKLLWLQAPNKVTSRHQ